MPDREMTPPPGKPVQDINTPVQTDGFYTILVNRDSDYYQAVYPIKRGQPYAGILNADERVIARYASNPLYFLKELRPGSTSASDFGSSDLWVLWVFATVPAAQDTYNSGIVYDEQDVNFPIFTRTLTVRRKTWEASQTIANGTALTGLLSVAITAPGINYTTATGAIATGATVQFVCFGGALIDGIVTNEGTAVASGGAITITGDGTGATATARIQPAGAKIVSQLKREFTNDDPRSNDYVQLIRVYRILPGPAIFGAILDDNVRGEPVIVSTQTVPAGTSPATGSLVISSVVKSVDSVTSIQTTAGVAELPPDEIWGFWDFIPLPLLLFDITNVIFCDGGPFFTLVSRPDTAMGSSVIRKHRGKVSYSTTYPTIDLSGSAPVTADLRYQGKVISFSFSNVLNDEITYSQNFITASGGSACGWTEEYDLPASVPSATEFAAGAWYVRACPVVPWGQSGWKQTLIEYYSAPGDPPIV